MPEDRDSRTEEATEHRLREAFEKGQFARSTEIYTVFLLIAVFIVLVYFSRSAANVIAWFTHDLFSDLSGVDLSPVGVVTRFEEIARLILKVLLPLLFASGIAGILAGGLQTGWKPTPKALKADLKRLDPIKGMERIISRKVLVQFLVDLAKFIIVGLILWFIIRQTLMNPLFSTPISIEYLGIFIWELTLKIFAFLIAAMVVIAAIDYAWQKQKTATDLRMTKQEVKEENKNMQGDPLVKAAQRRMMMRLLRKQMLSAVPTADVVVTNPTHYAVALKYERHRDPAPVVLAKGEGAFARRIKALAAEHGVPMVEDVPTARLLYRLGRVGETVPYELYQAVATILARVYQTHRYYFHRLKARRMEVTSHG